MLALFVFDLFVNPYHVVLLDTSPTKNSFHSSQRLRGGFVESPIYSYLRHHATEFGARILEMYPPLQAASDPAPECLKELLRSPLPA